MQLTETHEWINVFGAHYALGVDGLGLVLVLLTVVLVPVVVRRLVGRRRRPGNANGFFAWVLALEGLSLGRVHRDRRLPVLRGLRGHPDPGYFLIGGFGAGRGTAAVKFLIFSSAAVW